MHIVNYIYYMHVSYIYYVCVMYAPSVQIRDAVAEVSWRGGGGSMPEDLRDGGGRSKAAWKEAGGAVSY